MEQDLKILKIEYPIIHWSVPAQISNLLQVDHSDV
jgi:hypothetical protein